VGYAPGDREPGEDRHRRSRYFSAALSAAATIVARAENSCLGSVTAL